MSGCLSAKQICLIMKNVTSTRTTSVPGPSLEVVLVVVHVIKLIRYQLAVESSWKEERERAESWTWSLPIDDPGHPSSMSAYKTTRPSNGCEFMMNLSTPPNVRSVQHANKQASGNGPTRFVVAAGAMRLFWIVFFFFYILFFSVVSAYIFQVQVWNRASDSCQRTSHKSNRPSLPSFSGLISVPTLPILVD